MAEVDGTRTTEDVNGKTSSAGGEGAGGRAGRRESRGRAGALLKLGALALLVVGGYLIAKATPAGGYLTREGIGEGIAWLRGNPWAPPIFVGVYAAATALAVPGAVLTLAGGAVFGFYWGTLYNSIAANIGANAAFLIARSLGGGAVRRLIGKESNVLSKLDGIVERHGFRGLLTLRLIPLVPFNALNFGSGLMPLRWRTYAIATASAPRAKLKEAPLMLQLSDLLHGFDVKPLGDNRFEAPLINHYGQSAPDQENPANAIIGGGQLLGQAIVAATRSQPEKEVKTVHLVFSRAGWGADPLYLILDTVHAGGSYGTVGITFEQKGRPISKGVVMLTVPDPDLIRHAREMPVTDGPGHADTKLDVKGAWDLGTVAGAEVLPCPWSPRARIR